MRQGDKIRFRMPENSKYASSHFTPKKIYSGSVGKQLGDRLIVRMVGGFQICISKDDIVENVSEHPTIEKTKAPTNSDYKLFSDTCFEMAVRWRDNWTSIISGKVFKKRDYEGLHGGHFIERGKWATRHLPENVHAITSGENFAMSRGCVKTITAYDGFMKKTYGEKFVEELKEMAQKKFPRVTVSFLKDDAVHSYNYLNQFCDAEKELEFRIKKWPKTKTEKIMKVKEYLKL